MKLFWSSRSPYVRKVMVAAHELGIADKIEILPTTVDPKNPGANGELAMANPVVRIPALILDDGRCLGESIMICNFLNDLDGRSRLAPTEPAARFGMEQRHALGCGLIDVAQTMMLQEKFLAFGDFVERRAGGQYKLVAIADRLEQQMNEAPTRQFDLGHIAIAVGLAYADFRLADFNWRRGRPRLDSWFAEVSERQSMQLTSFRDDRLTEACSAAPGGTI